MSDVADYRRIVNGKLSQHASNVRTYRAEKRALRMAHRNTRDLKRALVLTQTVAAQVQADAHKRIAEVVTRSLEMVFEDDPYQFKIRFDKKRSKTEAVLTFERGGKEFDPMTATGGGVVAIAAFALRVSCVVLSKPPVRRFLVLDEPFANLSKDYVPRARALLLALSKELGFQFLLVTHLPELAGENVVEL